jgi:hypothetical protein
MGINSNINSFLVLAVRSIENHIFENVEESLETSVQKVSICAYKTHREIKLEGNADR